MFKLFISVCTPFAALTSVLSLSHVSLFLPGLAAPGSVSWPEACASSRWRLCVGEAAWDDGGHAAGVKPESGLLV